MSDNLFGQILRSNTFFGFWYIKLDFEDGVLKKLEEMRLKFEWRLVAAILIF